MSAVAGLMLFRWLERKRKYTLAGKGSATRRVIRSRGAQIAAAVLASVTVIVLVLPH
jgi:ABC-type Fe3+ transport system permease subunit